MRPPSSARCRMACGSGWVVNRQPAIGVSHRSPCAKIRFMIPTPEGASERLRFEPLCRAHAEPLSEALLDPAVYRFIVGPHPASIFELADDFERASKGPAAGREPMRWWNVGVFAADSHAGLGQLQATIHYDGPKLPTSSDRNTGDKLRRKPCGWFHDRLRETGPPSRCGATVAPETSRRCAC